MRFHLKRYLAALLAVILVTQAPLVLAFSCVIAPMEVGNVAGDSAGNVGEEKCPEISGNNDSFTLHQKLTSCQSASCCVVLSAAAIVDESFVNLIFQVESSRQDFADRLISTYLELNIRPPIN